MILKNSTNNVSGFFNEDADQHGTFLQFLRVSCALFIFVEIASVILDFNVLFGKSGPIPHDIQSVIASSWSVSYMGIISFGESLGVGENLTSVIFLSLFFLALLFMGMGWFQRIASLTTLFLYVAFTAGPFKYGVDLFVITALFYLCVFPPVYKIPAEDIPAEPPRKVNYTPYKRFFQLNVCMIYFFAGISKCISVSWYDGTAVWKSINLVGSNHLFKFNFDFLARHPWMLTAIGISILLVETLYPLAIWIKAYGINKIWLWMTITMHLGIGIVLNLYFFAAFMIILNISAFYFDLYEQKKHKPIKILS